MCCVNSVLLVLVSGVSLCCCLQHEFRDNPDFNGGFNPDFGGDFPPPYYHHGDDMNMHHHHDFDPTLEPSPDPPDVSYPVQHAGLPLDLAVYPLPLKDSDHELTFNVSWHPPYGGPAREYSIEINSITETNDCTSSICYEYDIPGSSTWWLVPKYPSPVAGACAVRPGCAYLVRLIAHPWDGHSIANLHVELDECVAGVCSCGHYINLPAPVVTAKTVSINGDIFVNITWTTPPPKEPKRLPPGLKIQRYAVSVAKQTISDVFANTVTRYVDADGQVGDGDVKRYEVIPITERSIERGNEPRDQARGIKTRTLVLDVRLMGRVKLIDDRGCVGPEGITTAYDPVEASKSYGTYILWALFGGACIAVMCALIAVSARVVKRFLNAFRPAPVSIPQESLRRRPAWFPLQLRTNEEISVRGQMENSPLYVHKEFEIENCDEWEVNRCRVHLGALIGSGAFGRVHVATLDMPGGETLTVAAKMLSEDTTEEESQDFLREIVMLKHVGVHKHVIRLIGCCTQRSPLMALLEHAPRGDLLSLLRSARGRRKVQEGSDVTRRADSGDTGNGRPSEGESEYTNFSDSDPALSDGKLDVDYEKSRDHYVAEPALRLDGSMMREYALQVALGMRHLEERGITHRDLAARNILVDGAGTLKVADFGLSRSGIYVHTRARPVPLRWLAPEAILHSQYCSASDVWAFAVLLWEIATLGGFPYAELSNHHVPPFLAGGGRLPKPARASPRLYQLMVECWSETPDTRPRFKDIVEKLQVQQQLYVDLETLPTDDAFSEFDFRGFETN